MYENDFNEMLSAILLCSTFKSLDGYGQSAFSTSATTYSAHISYRQKLVSDMDGKERMSLMNAIINCTGVVNADDKWTLPDGTSPPVIAVEQFSDTGPGLHHSRVWFGGRGQGDPIR